VLPRSPDCPVALLAGAGLDTLAVRVPDHPVALALLRQVGVPIAAPSANRSGQVSPTSAAHVLGGLDGRIAAVLDCGPCLVGVESTVVDLRGERPVILRPGGVTQEALEACIGPVGIGGAMQELRAPGMLASHYAPALAVRLQAVSVTGDEGLLAFGPPVGEAACVFQLSAAGNTTEAAANLFEGLRWLDAEGQRRGLGGIAVMPIPDRGLGRAVNDRLQRAAAPREA
jgi:L-threonylcarbamoyladenylate synthase